MLGGGKGDARRGSEEKTLHRFKGRGSVRTGTRPDVKAWAQKKPPQWAVDLALGVVSHRYAEFR